MLLLKCSSYLGKYKDIIFQDGIVSASKGLSFFFLYCATKFIGSIIFKLSNIY